jgi:hypothetical protein
MLACSHSYLLSRLVSDSCLVVYKTPCSVLSGTNLSSWFSLRLPLHDLADSPLHKGAMSLCSLQLFKVQACDLSLCQTLTSLLNLFQLD